MVHAKIYTELLCHAFLRLVCDLFRNHHATLNLQGCHDLTKALHDAFVGLWFVVQSRQNERLSKEARQVVSGYEPRESIAAASSSCLEVEPVYIIKLRYGKTESKKRYS